LEAALGSEAVREKTTDPETDQTTEYCSDFVMGHLSEPATVQRTAQTSAVAQGSEAVMEQKTDPEKG
jgi:hypothetical protein